MGDDEYLKKIGNNIKRIRTEKNIRQIDLADLCDFDKSNMRRIEAGNTNFTIKTLLKIAKSLEIDITDLIK